jgi:hypothetical protein
MGVSGHFRRCADCLHRLISDNRKVLRLKERGRYRLIGLTPGVTTTYQVTTRSCRIMTRSTNNCRLYFFGKTITPESRLLFKGARQGGSYHVVVSGTLLYATLRYSTLLYATLYATRTPKVAQGSPKNQNKIGRHKKEYFNNRYETSWFHSQFGVCL